MIKLLEKFGSVEVSESVNPDYLYFYHIDLGEAVTLRIAHTKTERLEMVLFSPEEMYRGARLIAYWSDAKASVSATRSEKAIENAIENAIAKFISSNEEEISDLKEKRGYQRQYVDSAIEATLAAHQVIGSVISDGEAYEISQGRLNRQTLNTMAMDGAHFNETRAYVSATQAGGSISIMFDDLTQDQATKLYELWQQIK